jgi:hypothetical protein
LPSNLSVNAPVVKSPPPPSGTKSSLGARLLIGAIALGLLGLFAWRMAPGAPPDAAKGPNAGARPVAVSVATVERKLRRIRSAWEPHYLGSDGPDN